MTKPSKPGFKLRPSEWIYIAGLFSLFAGLLITQGVGMALIANGAVLVTTSLINAWWMQSEVNDVI